MTIRLSSLNAAALLVALGSVAVPAIPANASSLVFDSGAVNGQMAAASQPSSTGKTEIETADDFVLPTQTTISSATFTGLLTGNVTTANIGTVNVEIYRAFPLDSDTTRTSGSPTFSTSQVPTRVNSPSDVAFALPSLNFTATVLSSTFTAANSIGPGGIHPKPNQTTGGNGSVSGQEVQFNISFSSPFSLAADRYFFVPQVQVQGGSFLWLSSERPIVSGTPLIPDLQGWTRDESLDPDWLRVGGDIVGGGASFNFAFSLSGDASETPLPGALPLFATGLATLGLIGWRRKRKTPVAKAAN